jgi:Tol biopolymer transport system component
MPVLASPTGSMTHTPEPTFQHGDSFSPSISADGRYVAFTSRSGVLIEGEMPQCTLPAGGQVHCNQVYAYDRQRGVMTLVSAAEDGAPGNGDSDHADISGDGGRVVFRSEANNLSPEAASPGGVYIRDLKTGGLERLAIDQPASEPTISDNGALVAFSAFSEHWDVFLYDQATGTTHQISLAHDGGVSDGDNQHARVSADGRWIAFWSWAGNLVPDDTQRCQESQTNFSCGDVFVYERESGKVQRIPAGEGYGSGMGYYHISLSGDGELIQFGCSIFNRIENQLVCGDGECCGKISADREWLAYGGVDFYVRELATGEEKLVSVSSEGIRGNGELVDYAISNEGENFEPGYSISADGRWVAFASTASNLAAEDSFVCSDYPFPPHNCYDIFVHDRETGVTEWISKPLTLRY